MNALYEVFLAGSGLCFLMYYFPVAKKSYWKMGSFSPSVVAFAMTDLHNVYIIL